MVTTATTDALVVVYALIEVAVSELERVLQATADRIAHASSGRESARRVL
jgi:DNA/RNA-binding domain of Phe-tRNA-synthetase-like protein